ncbi:MAG: TolC family protein [Cytophagaceae bacterium]|nr:TolC family protein [Cytophagaceae bacterium]
MKNKYAGKLLLWATLLTLSPLVRAQEARSFTLKEAVDYGVKNNLNVLNSQVDIESARARIQEIKAAGLPQVNLSANLSRTIRVQPFFSPPGTTLGPPDPNAPVTGEETVFALGGVNYTSNAVGSVSQLIFSSSYLIGLKAAKAYTELASKNLNASKVTVAENVTKAYYNVLVNEERINLLGVNVSRLDSLLRDTRAMNEQGLVEKLDVQRLEVQSNNLKTEKQNVERLQELALVLLKFQMGYPLDQSVSLSEKLAKLDFSEAYVNEISRPFNYANRIEYSTLETQHVLQSLDVQNIQKSYLPQVSFSGNYGYFNGRQSLDRFITRAWFPAGSAGFNVNVPIFDGFARRYKLAQSRNTLLKADNGLKLLAQSIDLQLSQSQIQLRNYWYTLQEQQKNLDLANEILRVTRIKYREGVGSNIEVINAETSFREAQTNYYTALYNALVAKVDLDKAAGRLFNEGMKE